MSAAFKTSIGVLAILAVAVLSPVDPGATAGVDFLLGAGLVVWRVGIVRSALVAGVLYLLAAAAITPMCGGDRSRAYFAAMKSDLKNLASQQEIHHADHSAYSVSFQELAFVTSHGVSVLVTASPRGWSASATHAALASTEGCAIYWGEVPVPSIEGVSPGAPGEIVCTM
jgi:hypothetical protein